METMSIIDVSSIVLIYGAIISMTISKVTIKKIKTPLQNREGTYKRGPNAQVSV